MAPSPPEMAGAGEGLGRAPGCVLLSTIPPPSIPLLLVAGLSGTGLGLLMFTVQVSGGGTVGLLMVPLLSPAPVEVLVPGRGSVGTVLLSPAVPSPPRVPLLGTVTLPVVPLPASRAGRVEFTVLFPVQPRGRMRVEFRVEFRVTFPGRVAFSKGAVALVTVLLLRALHGVVAFAPVPAQGAGTQAPVALLKVVP